MSSEIPYSGEGAKNTAKGELLSPSEGRRKKERKTPDLTRGGNSNDIAQGPIDEVLRYSQVRVGGKRNHLRKLPRNKLVNSLNIAWY